MSQATVKLLDPAADAPAPSGPSAGLHEQMHLDTPTSAAPVRLRTAAEIGADSSSSYLQDPPAEAPLFVRLHRSHPEAAHQLAQSATAMPEVGTEILGFRLLGDLGKGAFARVYLAQQGDLANRTVVLKVSPSMDEELQTLAQLQHTNIVPIYSVHRAGPLQAVCMPYFGATTLAQVLQEWKDRDSLPKSGKELVDTIVARKSTARDMDTGRQPGNQTGRQGDKEKAKQRDAETGRQGDKEKSAGSVSPCLPVCVSRQAAPAGDQTFPPTIGSTVHLERLQKLNYVEAVLWISSGLADGLAHAHERGIVHRDLKPANILLTDEGQAMLLDFNLAHDTKPRGSAAVAQIGGTLPYMAPEQLDAYRGETLRIEHRSDIYALGVILYELLTGTHPFPGRDGLLKHVLDKMIVDRSAAPPRLCPFNPAISPAVESIIRHCLEPDPARRYQSANHLKEDIDRHLAHLPLKYAPEPSRRERFGKWRRRHPRLTSVTMVAALCGLLIAGLAGLVVARERRLGEIEARAALNRFLDDKKAAQYLLTAQLNDAGQLESGMLRCRQALAGYGLPDASSWQEGARVRRLSSADQNLLRRSAGELLFLWARAAALQAANQTDTDRRDLLLGEAIRLNSLAESCSLSERPSRAVLLQRAELKRLLGDGEEAQRLEERAARTPLATSTDHYLVAAENIAQGKMHEALPLLAAATEQDPQDFWAWFLQGVCHDHLAHANEALACYGTCIALAPDSPWAYLNRGLAHLRQRNYQRASADLDQAIALRPELAEAYRNRALARQGLQQYDGAIEDFTRSLDLGASPTQIYFLRAEARARAGDRAGAQRDRDLGLRHEPKDEMGWLARGYARIGADLEGALADFDKALQFNPRSLTALQNKAHVLSKLGRNEEAARTLDKAVAISPDFILARAGRGVLLARLAQREAAHKDAEECLARDNQPLTLYQLAGIYALTSRTNAQDRQQAFRLLSVALQKGVGYDLLETDADLDPIRNCPEFQTLVNAARAIRTAAVAETSKNPPR